MLKGDVKDTDLMILSSDDQAIEKDTEDKKRRTLKDIITSLSEEEKERFE